MFDFFFTKPSDPHLVEEGPYTWAEISGILNRPDTIPAMLDLRTQNPPPLGAFYLPKRLQEPRYFIRWRAAGKTATAQQAGCEQKDSGSGEEEEEETRQPGRKGAGTGGGTKKRERRRIRKERREEEVFDEKAVLGVREDQADVVRAEEVFDEKAALYAQDRADVTTALPEYVPPPTPKRQRSLARAGERLPAWMRSPSKPRREFTVLRRGQE